jgi:hypothetical protein
VQNPQVKRQHSKDEEIEDDPKEELVQSEELEMKPIKRAKDGVQTSDLTLQQTGDGGTYF